MYSLAVFRAFKHVIRHLFCVTLLSVLLLMFFNYNYKLSPDLAFPVYSRERTRYVYFIILVLKEK